MIFSFVHTLMNYTAVLLLLLLLLLLLKNGNLFHNQYFFSFNQLYSWDLIILNSLLVRALHGDH